MVSKAVSLRIPDELLAKLEADALDDESLGSTIQRVLLEHYGLAIDSGKFEHLQILIADEVEKRIANLIAGYYDLKTQVDTLNEQVTKLQTVKTTRKKPLTT